jgi:hypothetical protein
MTLTATTFLFRLDGAQENEAFLDLARSKGHFVYAGLAMTLERGWVPDFVEAVIDDDGGAPLPSLNSKQLQTWRWSAPGSIYQNRQRTYSSRSISISNAFFSAAAQPPTLEPTTFSAFAMRWTAVRPS